MPTFLEMVNNLFLKLRDERVSSFGDTDRVLAAKMLINESAREVIEGYEWSFSIRDDGMLYFPPKISGTTASTQKTGKALRCFSNWPPRRVARSV